VVTGAARFSKTNTGCPPAFAAVDAWAGFRQFAAVAESNGHWEELASWRWPQNYPARASMPRALPRLCLHHGVRELWTADRDFSCSQNSRPATRW